MHKCEGETPQCGYSAAIVFCYEKYDGTLWAGDDGWNHVSQVAFCPYCGFKATVPPEYAEKIATERLL